MSFLARFVSDNCGSEKLDLGRPSSTTTPYEKLSARCPSSCSWLPLHVRFELLSSINFRDINGFPKLGTHNPYDRSAQRARVHGIFRFYIYDFLLVIKYPRPYLAPFPRYIVFDMSNVAIFGYFSCVLPSSKGFPWNDLCKILLDGQWMARLQNVTETLPKISTGWV